VSSAVVAGTIAGSFERITDKIINNQTLQTEIEKRYMALRPGGILRNTVDLSVDVVEYLSKLDNDDRNDMLANWLREATDGKVESLEPTADPIDLIE